jgi:hypothetical protein
MGFQPSSLHRGLRFLIVLLWYLTWGIRHLRLKIGPEQRQAVAEKPGSESDRNDEDQEQQYLQRTSSRSIGAL